MHTECREWLTAVIDFYGHLFPRRPGILEVGSLNINGSAREYFGALAGAYIGCDIRKGPGVDLHADVMDLPEDAVKFDMIVSTEVLEHAPNAKSIVEKLYRLLKPDGWLILTCASDVRKPHNAYGGEHPDEGEYYAGIAEADLFNWAHDTGFHVEELTHLTWPGDLRLVARKVGSG